MNGWITPDTTGYLVAGYAVIGGMIGGYILSLVWRWRQAVRRFQELKKRD